MSTFKVICKAEGKSWERSQRRSKIVTTSKVFGLFKSSKIVSEPDYVPGPDKDEICIVNSECICDKEKHYHLKGYPYGCYHSKYFIRLDGFTETQKEIAEKSQPILN